MQESGNPYGPTASIVRHVRSRTFPRSSNRPEIHVGFPLAPQDCFEPPSGGFSLHRPEPQIAIANLVAWPDLLRGMPPIYIEADRLGFVPQIHFRGSLMRFSLRSAFLVVTLIALVCAALLNHSAIWVSVIVSLSLLFYAVALIHAIVSERRDRAKALAFVAVGGCYFLLATTTFFRVHDYLITNYPIAWIARAAEIPGANLRSGGGFFSVPSEINIAVLQLQQFGGGQPSLDSLEDIIAAATTDAPYSKELQRFFIISHCMFSWLFGGLAAWWTARLIRQKAKD
jgi:hypothetical protein